MIMKKDHHVTLKKRIEKKDISRSSIRIEAPKNSLKLHKKHDSS